MHLNTQHRGSVAGRKSWRNTISYTSRILKGEIIFTWLPAGQDAASDAEQCIHHRKEYSVLTKDSSAGRIDFCCCTSSVYGVGTDTMHVAWADMCGRLASAAGLPCTKTDKHLKLPVLPDVSGRVVDGTHEAAEVAHSGLPVFIWSHLPLLRTFKVHLWLFC